LSPKTKRSIQIFGIFEERELRKINGPKTLKYLEVEEKHVTKSFIISTVHLILLR
jgi:hypothetical protein